MRFRLLLILISMVTLLSACNRYSFSVNENEVYAPVSLFTNYSFADSSLGSCVDQHLRSISADSADDLAVLNCSNAGIVLLDGIEVFSRIEQLSLSDNNLTNVDALLQLVNLSYLDLRGNTEIDCAVARQLQTVLDGTVFIPQQCN